MTGKLDVIIAGGGRVGFRTAEILAERGDDITIIEWESDRVTELADEWIATVIEGDATNPGILEQAGLGDADAIASLTGNAGLNLAICMVAKELQPGIRTVSRIETAEREAYTRFVDAVVFPEQPGAQVAANEIVGSDVRTLTDVTSGIDILQIRVAKDAPAAGKPLSEVTFPEGTLIVSDDHGDCIAGPDTTLTAGNQYVVAVEPEVVDEVLNLLRG